MRNSKLFYALQSLDKYEQNRFQKFLQSPYFNRDPVIIDLFRVLCDYINEKLEEPIEKDTIWKTIILDKSYDDIRFRKYCSDLLKLLEDYLIQQAFDQNQILKSSLLLESLNAKKLDRLYVSSLRTANTILQQFPYQSADFYFNKYKLEKISYDLNEYETKRDERSNVEEISQNIDHFFLAEKLRISSAVLSQQNVAAHSYNLFMKDEVLDHIRNNYEYYEDIPPIALYYQIYLTLAEDENEAHYFKLKELLDRFSLKFPTEEARDVLYLAAQNYCIRKSYQGNQKFLNELFILYKDLLSKGIILAENQLSPWYFRNIITTGLRLKEYDWTENFIKDFQSYLPSSFKDNAVNYSLAQVYFYQKKYDKVIQELQNVEYEDVAYNLNSKTMLIATYYEIDEIEPLFSILESFRTYLNRHKDIPEWRRKYYINLIKYTKKLTKIIPNDLKAVEKLKTEVESTQNIASIDWLKEKITELSA